MTCFDNGGIWKSTDNGATWISLVDHLDNENVPVIQAGNPRNGATVIKVVHRANQPAKRLAIGRGRAPIALLVRYRSLAIQIGVDPVHHPRRGIAVVH